MRHSRVNAFQYANSNLNIEPSSPFIIHIKNIFRKSFANFYVFGLALPSNFSVNENEQRRHDWLNHEKTKNALLFYAREIFNFQIKLMNSESKTRSLVKFIFKQTVCININTL